MPDKQSLNRKETKVMTALWKRGRLTIRQMARICFPGVRPITKADSCVRNALRKLRKQKRVRRVEEGTYQA